MAELDVFTLTATAFTQGSLSNDEMFESLSLGQKCGASIT